MNTAALRKSSSNKRHFVIFFGFGPHLLRVSANAQGKQTKPRVFQAFDKSDKASPSSLRQPVNRSTKSVCIAQVWISGVVIWPAMLPLRFASYMAVGAFSRTVKKKWKKNSIKRKCNMATVIYLKLLEVTWSEWVSYGRLYETFLRFRNEAHHGAVSALASLVFPPQSD